VLAGEHEMHAGMRARPRDVDPYHARMRHVRPQQFAVDHPRQYQVVGELGLAGDLRAGVDATARFADDLHRMVSGARRAGEGFSLAFAVLSIAASTASKICW